MKKNLENCFSTGEFAKLFHINKQTLFYYDKIGLFSPEITDDNGYRYYSYYQAEYFSVINSLRELNVSIKEIKDYLEHRSPEELLNFLNDKVNLINNEISRLNRLKETMNNKIDVIETTLELNNGKVFIRPLPHQYVIFDESFETTDNKEYIKEKYKYFYGLKDFYLETSRNVITLVLVENILKGRWDIWSGFCTRIKNPDSEGKAVYRPPQNYVVAYHKGEWDTIGETYAKIIDFAKENSIELGHISFQEYVIDEICVPGIENYYTKISVEIKNQNSLPKEYIQSLNILP